MHQERHSRHRHCSSSRAPAAALDAASLRGASTAARSLAPLARIAARIAASGPTRTCTSGAVPSALGRAPSPTTPTRSAPSATAADGAVTAVRRPPLTPTDCIAWVAMKLGGPSLARASRAAPDARAAPPPTDPSRLAPSSRRLRGATNACSATASLTLAPTRSPTAPSAWDARPRKFWKSPCPRGTATLASPPLLPSDPSQVVCPLLPKPLHPSPNAILWTLTSASSIGAVVSDTPRPIRSTIR